MRKILFSPILLLALNAFGQAAPPPPQPGQPQGPMQMPDFIVPVQIGTDTLKNGKATVTLSQQTLDEMKQSMASPDYVVMLTPTGECGPLTVAERNANSFVVKEQKGSGTANGIFQYMMIVKQKRPARPGRPMPMGPAGGQAPQVVQPTPPAPPAQPQGQH